MDLLIDLHNRVNAVCPIEGIALRENGEYRIDFLNEATEQQREQARAIVDNYSPTPDPEWGKFRVGMIKDLGYNRIASAVYRVNPLLQQRLETAISVPIPNLELIQLLWDQIILLVPPTMEEIRDFNKLTVLYNIPIQFLESGDLYI